MKKMLFLIAAAALTLGACRSLTVNDFRTELKNPEPLPRLNMQIHEESFALAFGIEMMERQVMGSPGNPMGWGPSPFELFTQLGLPMQDVFKMLGNEVADNLTTATGEKHGNARFKLLHYDSRMPGWGYMIPSTLTMFTANLLGMPFNVLRSEVELQLEITDANKKVLAQYRAPGSGKARIQMYKGYSGVDANRKANLLALQDAMTSIKKQIIADAPTLKAQLLAAQQ